MKATPKRNRHFSLLRFLLIISLKDIFKAECARQYILGDATVAKDFKDFEEWRLNRYYAEHGIRVGGTPKASQALRSGQYPLALKCIKA